MMTLPELRDRLDALRVTLRHDGERIHASGGALPADVQAAMRHYKPVLLAMLRAHAGESFWYRPAVTPVMHFIFEVSAPLTTAPTCAVCGLPFWREYVDRRHSPIIYRYICNVCWPLPAPQAQEGEDNDHA